MKTLFLISLLIILAFPLWLAPVGVPQLSEEGFSFQEVDRYQVDTDLSWWTVVGMFGDIDTGTLRYSRAYMQTDNYKLTLWTIEGKTTPQQDRKGRIYRARLVERQLIPNGAGSSVKRDYFYFYQAKKKLTEEFLELDQSTRAEGIPSLVQHFEGRKLTIGERYETYTRFNKTDYFIDTLVKKRERVKIGKVKFYAYRVDFVKVMEVKTGKVVRKGDEICIWFAAEGKYWGKPIKAKVKVDRKKVLIITLKPGE